MVLTRRLSDPVNRYADEFLHRVVLSVNGRAVRDYADFVATMDSSVASTEHVVIRFRSEDRPLVLRSAEIRASNERIRARFGIVSDRRLPATRVETGR